MRTSAVTALLGTLALSACNPPPDAPVEFTELGLFLFEFFADDEAILADGVQNMETWLLDNLDAKSKDDDEDTIRDGYTVRDFDLALLASVRDDVDAKAEGSIAGSAVATNSAFDVEVITQALTFDEQEHVFPNSIVTHERVFRSGGNCFADRSCALLDTENVVYNSFGNPPLDLDVSSNSRSQYRWVTYGPNNSKVAMLNRTWLQEDAETGGTLGGIVQLNEQMYLRAVLPWEGGAVMVGNTWVAATITDLNESIALRKMVNGMKDQGVALDKYLAAQ